MEDLNVLHLNPELLERAADGETLGQDALDHLQVCERCREQVEVLGYLRASRLEAKNREPLRTVMNQSSSSLTWRKNLRRRQLRQRTVGAVAALVLGGLVWTNSLGWLTKSKNDPIEVVKEELSSELTQTFQWLCEQQKSSGAWKVEEWGGRPRFEVGISALACLSLMSSERLNVECEAALQKGLAHLLSVQREDGGFGPTFVGDLYNHSLATLALERGTLLGLQVPVEAVASARRFLLGLRDNEGRWGYRPGLRGEWALSRWTEWAVLEEHGEDSHPLWGEKRLLQSSARTQTHSETLVDDARSIFQKDKASPLEVVLGGAQVNESDYKIWLMSVMERKGQLRGTWAGLDPWEHVGGVVYSTGMAVLALNLQQ